MPDPAIRCTGLVKRYDGAPVLDGFDLEVAAGTILGLLGPSGSGKTTTLRLIAGFDHPDEGVIEISGRIVAGAGRPLPPERRRVGMVFQDYALFPHLDVAGNVSYGLPRGPGRRPRAAEVLDLVGLRGVASRMPHELSGGEQQRVALARALAPRPAVVLLDEPFSNLDAPRRDLVRREVRTILVEARTTALFVTHDQEEALAMSDEVAVMRDGRVLQAAAPADLYHRPVDCWVARFLGEAEFIEAAASGGVVETPFGKFPATGLTGPVEVMIRPEMVAVTRSDRGTATVTAREFYGHDQLVAVDFDDGRHLLARHGPEPVFLPGDRVEVSVAGVVAFPAHPGRDH